MEHAGWSLSSAAEAAGISDRTARKWLRRYHAEGREGLLDRSSAPATDGTDERRVEVIAALRRRSASHGCSLSASRWLIPRVSGIHQGLGKLGRLGLEPAERYERE